MVPKQSKSQSRPEPSKETKGGLVQFRADEQLLGRLTDVASRYNLPVGALARLWVTERLERETDQELGDIHKWLAERYHVIDSVMKTDYEDGPIQIIHILPFARPQEINPEDARRQQGLLPPVEHVDEYFGKINLYGYVTVKQFKSAEKPSGYVQVFRTGELESARVLQHNDVDRFIFIDRVDSDLIRSTWSYCTALEALNVASPVLLQIGFSKMKGFALRSRKFEESTAAIDVDTFKLPSVKISNWSQVNKIDGVAELLKRSIDTLWNAAGVQRSYSYSASGDWLGPEDVWGESKYGEKKTTSMRKEVIDLSGINPTPDRVDLVMNYGGRNYVVGKVRIPYVTPGSTSEFACRVYQNDMEHRSKAMIETANHKNDVVEFTAGNLKIRGRVQRLVEGFAGGAFDGINIPLERNLMLSFYIQPV